MTPTPAQAKQIAAIRALLGEGYTPSAIRDLRIYDKGMITAAIDAERLEENHAGR